MAEYNTLDQVRYAIRNAVSAPGNIKLEIVRTPGGVNVTKVDPVSGGVVMIGFFRLSNADYQSLLLEYRQGG